MPVQTEHNWEDGELVTTKRVILQDATGASHTHDFVGTPDATDVDEYEYAGDGEPTDAALEVLRDHLNGAGDQDDVDEV